MKDLIKYDLFKNESIKIFIDTNNLFFNYGMSSLVALINDYMWESYNVLIVSTKTISDADMVIKLCEIVDITDYCWRINPAKAGSVGKTIFAINSATPIKDNIYKCANDYFDIDIPIDQAFIYLKSKMIAYLYNKNQSHTSVNIFRNDCQGCACAEISDDDFLIINNADVHTISELAVSTQRSYNAVSLSRRKLMRKLNISSTRDLLRFINKIKQSRFVG